MGTRSGGGGTATLLLAAWLALAGTAGAQGLQAPPAVGADLRRSEGECAERREPALLAPQACAQELPALPTWLGPLPGPGPGPGNNAGGSLALERARDVSGRLRSPEYLERLDAEKERLRREVFGRVLEAYPEAPGSGASGSGGLPATDRIYLFISESVPLETLRNYARDVADLGDPRIVMVLRGFVGGMKHVLPTRRFVLDVLRKDLACDPDVQGDCGLRPVNLVIDPRLFRRYGVQEVPAVVYSQDVAGSETDGGDPPTGNVWSISGDASFGYLLARIEETVTSSGLDAVLEEVRTAIEASH